MPELRASDTDDQPFLVFRLTRPEARARRRLAKLQVLDKEQPPQLTADIIEAGVTQLMEAGLKVSRRRGATMPLVGGTEVTDARGIEAYSQPFVIWLEDSKFAAGVEGRGDDAPVCVGTFEEAIEVVLRIYRERRWLPFPAR